MRWRLLRRKLLGRLAEMTESIEAAAASDVLAAGEAPTSEETRG
jgi:hypothetical protein